MTKNNSHTTHKDVFLKIQKSTFAEHFLAVKGVYRNKRYYKIIIDNVIEYKSTEEQIESTENDKKSKNILKTSEYDAVLLIKSLQKYNNSVKARTTTIIFEIKTNEEDLQRDHKINKYFRASDYFFLAVPTALVKEAYQKCLREFKKNITKIGIYNYEKDEIVILPNKQKRIPFRHKKILCAMFSSYKLTSNTEPIYQFEEIDKKSIRIIDYHYKKIDDIHVNAFYKRILENQ